MCLTAGEPPADAHLFRLVLTLLEEMQRHQERCGVASVRIGGGMGAAGIFELIQ